MSGGLRICFCLRDFSGGGAERMMVFLANQLNARGHRPCFVVWKDGGEARPLLEPDIPVLAAGTHGIFRGLPGVARLIAQVRPDIVLSSTMQVNVALLTARAVRLVRARLVVRESSTLSWAIRRSRLGGLVRRFGPFLYGKADAVVCVSEEAKRDFRECVGEGVATVETIVNPAPVPRPGDADWPVSLPPGHPVVLAAGRLSREKGFDLLIGAAAMVERPITVVIMGEGPERAALEEQVRRAGLADRVFLPGYTDRLSALMRKADLLVLPSRYEGMPNVLLEALAVGLPVVSTDCRSGPAEILDGGRYGRLVPVEDAAALAQGIEETLRSPPEPAPSAHLARFSPEACVDRYEALMMRVHACAA